MSKPSDQVLRHRARKRAVQAIYQWQLTGQSADAILAQFAEQASTSRIDDHWFAHLVRSVIAHAGELDAALAPYLDRDLDRVDPIERAVLRLGACELLYCPELPWRVVLDEAVELAHTFGAEQGHAYVNGVLDPLARAGRDGKRDNAGR